MGNLKIDPQQFFAGLLVFVVAITVHEFMHAFTAYRLGDTTAARLGRVTLNPVAHFDPLGFLFTIMLLLGIGFIAWGRPVPVNPGNLRNPKRGMLLIAAAGPLSNLVMATLAVIPLYLARDAIGGWPEFTQVLLGKAIQFNILLAAFNLVPIPPLDGHKILTGLLPDFWYPILAPLEQYGFMILLAFLFLPSVLGVNLLGAMAGPVQLLISNLLLRGLN